MKKDQEQVSALNSPRQGDKRDPKAPRVKHKGEGPGARPAPAPRLKEAALTSLIGGHNAQDGQHNNDAHDYDKSKGPDNPGKSVDMNTGTPKNQETYREQAARHEDSGKQAQSPRREWNEDTRDKPTIEDSPRARDSDITGGKSGSDSNASSGTSGH